MEGDEEVLGLFYSSFSHMPLDDLSFLDVPLSGFRGQYVRMLMRNFSRVLVTFDELVFNDYDLSRECAVRDGSYTSSIDQSLLSKENDKFYEKLKDDYKTAKERGETTQRTFLYALRNAFIWQQVLFSEMDNKLQSEQEMIDSAVGGEHSSPLMQSILQEMSTIPGRINDLRVQSNIFRQCYRAIVDIIKEYREPKTH